MKHNLEKFNNLIESLELLPSIGKKSARNIALYLVKENKYAGIKIAHAIEEAIRDITNCKFCGGLSEHEVCDICANEYRDKILAIVEGFKDILTIEESGSYEGYYFVLNHLDDENIQKIRDIIKEKQIKEVIFAFPPSAESEARSLYLEDKLKDLKIEFSQIAQGVPTGVHFENVDINSLAKAIKLRFKI